MFLALERRTTDRETATTHFTENILQIFTPDCAWIRAMIKILAELHCEPDLKLNLKFEIEVLCKELQVDLRVRIERRL